MIERRPNETTFANEVFVIDPRNQGFGLHPFRFLDHYANKFLSLTGRDALYISPSKVPDDLRKYYEQIGYEVAKDIIHSKVDMQSTLIQNLNSELDHKDKINQRKGLKVVPYMVSHEVEKFAADNGLETLASPNIVDNLGDKGIFLDQVNQISDQVLADMGIDISLRFHRHLGRDLESIKKSFVDISENSQKNAVLVKPKSASGLGVFLLRQGTSQEKLEEILSQNFTSEEEILVEAYVSHTHAGSMQGISTQEEYTHLYLGKQNISLASSDQGFDGVEYSSSQIPFEASENIEAADLDKLKKLNQFLGTNLLTNQSINGISGFDFLANFDINGSLKGLKFTEVNLHLPSTMAVYSAVRKLL